jgi:hypothetical protein
MTTYQQSLRLRQKKWAKVSDEDTDDVAQASKRRHRRKILATNATWRIE